MDFLYAATSTLDTTWVSIIIAVVAGLIGATIGFGRRNTALSESQSKAVDAAALQITALQNENNLQAERISSLESNVHSLGGRLAAAERMATSKDLILDALTHYGCPEEILAKYR